MEELRIEFAGNCFLTTPNAARPEECNFYFLQRRYSGKNFPTFPIEAVIDDTVHLIEMLLPRIDGMLGSKMGA